MISHSVWLWITDGKVLLIWSMVYIKVPVPSPLYVIIPAREASLVVPGLNKLRVGKDPNPNSVWIQSRAMVNA